MKRSVEYPALSKTTTPGVFYRLGLARERTGDRDEHAVEVRDDREQDQQREDAVAVLHAKSLALGITTDRGSRLRLRLRAQAETSLPTAASAEAGAKKCRIHSQHERLRVTPELTCVDVGAGFQPAPGPPEGGRHDYQTQVSSGIR